ncbi:MAG: DUF4115 domain-containing protein [candidate division NC10 bacterium]|nr:DUF4115 domain-containing protein [candidate division NC10 bacterium]
MAEHVSIGQTLRGRREERGLTPEQAAFQSKVPIRLLQALESDDYRALPDAAYLTRFLHEYARLLKLDPSPLEVEFRKAIRRPPASSLVPAIPPAPRQAIPWTQVLWTATAILVVIPLVFIALSVASKRAGERPGSPQVADGPGEERGPDAADQPLASRPEDATPGEAVVPGEPLAPPSTGPEIAGPAPEIPTLPASPADLTSRRFLLTARALEATWMVVRADHGQQREVLLRKGQTARFVADTGFVITVGNAGGVDLSLNGRSVPSLGKSGQVVRDFSVPPLRQAPDTPGAMPPGAAPPRASPQVAPATPPR